MNTRVIKLFRLNVCHFNSRARSTQTQLRHADMQTYTGIIIEAKTQKFSLNFDKIQ